MNIDELKQYKPHYFGLGFIQLKLDQETRLHFYHPEVLPIVDQEEIHNHRYRFVSKVLMGSLWNDIFYPKLNTSLDLGVGTPEYGIYAVSCKAEDSGKPSEFQRFCEPVHLSTFETPRGSEYFLKPEAFHRVRINQPTITLLKRGEIEYEKALVIKKVGSPDVCPFSKKMTDDELWGIIEEVLKYW